jgi:hypothetical protein
VYNIVYSEFSYYIALYFVSFYIVLCDTLYIYNTLNSILFLLYSLLKSRNSLLDPHALAGSTSIFHSHMK